MTRTLIALALALSATSASAQDYNRQDLVRGLCQKDGCDEFTILAADRIRTSDEGTLFKTRVQTFHASHAGRQERGQENGYVFCSSTRPAIMAEQNGQTMAFFLAPFATQESRESVRKNANFHALYFAICHGWEAGRAAVHNLAGVAQSHGYRVALAQSKLVPLKRAEDVLTTAGDPSERTPAEARRDVHPERSPIDERRDRAPIEVRSEERFERPVEARRYKRLDRAQGEASWDEPRDRPPLEAPRYERFDRAPDHPRGYERWERAPEEALGRERLAYREPLRQAPPGVVEEDRDEGFLSGARRLTNRAFDALDGAGDWVTGRERN
jgi:hypothetical protein